MGHSQHPHVIGVMPAQAGKSNALFNDIGLTLDDRPMPLLYIAPSRDLAMTVVEPKIDDMLRSCPTLWEKTAKGKRYTRAVKRIDGVPLRLAWGGSTTQLKADNAGKVYVDEVDEFDEDINHQGSIIELADARHASYPNGQTIATSTPTEGNVNTYVHPITGFTHWEVAESAALPSQIWMAWQLGSRHEWAWPCPLCMHYFVPRFDLIKFDSKATEAEIDLHAHVVCPCCDGAILSSKKTWMNRYGVYVAPGQYVFPRDEAEEFSRIVDAQSIGKIPERDAPEVLKIAYGDYLMPTHGTTRDCSMWASGLAHFSTRRTFGQIANAYLRSARSGRPESIKGTINTVLNECFRFGGEVPDLDEVRGRKGAYLRGQVPDWVTQVFLTADVQNDRIVLTVRGWGPRGQSALLEWGELWGDTSEAPTFRMLNDYLQREYGGIHVRAAAIDSGNRTMMVYDLCREHAGLMVPTKGRDTMDQPFKASNIDVAPDGRTVKYSLQLWHINTDMAKSFVHSRMSVEDDDAGAWYVPADVDEYYLKQIVAEQRIPTAAGKVKWHKTGRNDYLDCEALQWFLFRCLGPVEVRPMLAQQPGTAPSGARVHSKGIEV